MLSLGESTYNLFATQRKEEIPAIEGLSVPPWCSHLCALPSAQATPVLIPRHGDTAAIPSGTLSASWSWMQKHPKTLRVWQFPNYTFIWAQIN